MEIVGPAARIPGIAGPTPDRDRSRLRPLSETANEQVLDRLEALLACELPGD